MMLLNAAKDSNLISGRFRKSKVVVGCHFSLEIPLKRMPLEGLSDLKPLPWGSTLEAHKCEYHVEVCLRSPMPLLLKESAPIIS